MLAGGLSYTVGGVKQNAFPHDLAPSSCWFRLFNMGVIYFMLP